jgi:uncharacterized protein (DUF58 family)
MLLVAAVSLAAGARSLFLREQDRLGTVAVVLALLLCCGVIYLCAPFVARATHFPRLRLPLGFRITRQGVVFVAAVFAVAVAALFSANNLFYLVLSCLLAAMVLSGLVSRLGLAGLQLNISFPRHIFANQRSLAQVSVRNLKRWMPSFSIWVGATGVSRQGADVVMEEFYCPMITGGGVAAGSLPVTFAHRGIFHHRAVWLRSSFPFSFVERRTRLDLGREVLVYPSIESSAEVEGILSGLGRWLQGSAPGDSHDLYRIRPSVPGESARFLDWKASARVGELMVREFSREDHRRLNIVFDHLLPPGEEARERFEKVVGLCSAVVWGLHHLNAEICFSAEDKTILSSPNSGAVYQILRYLALVEPAAAVPGREPARPAPQAARGEWFQLIFSARPEAGWPALQSSKGRYFFSERL